MHRKVSIVGLLILSLVATTCARNSDSTSIAAEVAQPTRSVPIQSPTNPFDLVATIFSDTPTPQPSIDKLIDQLIEDVQNASLQRGIMRALVSKLETAHMKLSDQGVMNDVVGLNAMEAFIHEVNGLFGKIITVPLATQFISDAEAIIFADTDY